MPQKAKLHTQNSVEAPAVTAGAVDLLCVLNGCPGSCRPALPMSDRAGQQAAPPQVYPACPMSPHPCFANLKYPETEINIDPVRYPALKLLK